MSNHVEADSAILRFRSRASALLWLLAASLLAGAVYLALFWAPTERELGDAQRIFYLHLPMAIVAFAFSLVLCLASLTWLLRRRAGADALAVSAAELGLLTSTLVLVTGSIFARPAWGVWWTWDPRLTTMLVLWFMYVGYFVLRAALPEGERRATLAAVIGIVAFLDVPLVFMSIRWWRTIHPTVLTREGLAMEPPMAVTLAVCLLAIVAVFGLLLWLRYRLEIARRRLADLRSDGEGLE